MSSKPDAHWQALIDDYLNKLHGWQKLASRQSSSPAKKSRRKKSTKLDAAYQQMKAAEKALKEYEAQKGY